MANRLYRYSVSQDVLRRGPDACPVGRVQAAGLVADAGTRVDP